MATITRAVCKVTRNLRNSGSLLQKEYIGNKILGNVTTRHIRKEIRSGQLRDILSKYRRVLCGTSGSVIGFAVAYSWVSKHKDVFAAEVQLEGYSPMSGKKEKPEYRLSRVIKSATDDTGLKITLYQYQTCPFCCKVRASLDYYGFAYNIVEVNSVTRKQTKWSNYKKVPILVCEGVGKDGFLQLNDSSVIISILESFLEDRNTSLETFLSYYPPMETTNNRGKKVLEFANKYFIMYGDNKTFHTAKQMEEERKWRAWVEKELVHMLSPNVYQSPREALQAFRYFSNVGEWEQNFSTLECNMVIYIGAAVMYFMGKYLKYKYCKNDVRESLYDSLDTWVRAVGKRRKFMGGHKPNLADLVSLSNLIIFGISDPNGCKPVGVKPNDFNVFQSVYGVLSSIEGCDTWQEALENTRIKHWFENTKAAVDSHAGAPLMATKAEWVKGS